MRQPQLFETEDQYGNDIIQGPKLPKKNLTTKEAMIDPKNPTYVGSSYWNLGNHLPFVLYYALSLWYMLVTNNANIHVL